LIRQNETSGARTLHRGLDILENALVQPRRLGELARDAGLPVNTARRLVKSLVARKFLRAGEQGEFVAGAQIFKLASHAANNADLLKIAYPHLKELAKTTGHCAFLGRRDGDYSVHLLRCPGRNRVLIATPPGTRRRLDETSIGKALRCDETSERATRPSHDADSSARDYVLNVGPPPDNIRSIGAPVRDASGAIVAAISIATTSLYLSEDDMPEVALLVREAARKISHTLGWL